MRAGAIAFMAAGGLLTGWLVNLLVVRVPDRLAFWPPGQRCGSCGTPRGWHRQLPVVSWVAARGRCHRCGGSIPAGFPLVEVANAVVWALAAWRFRSWLLVAMVVLFSLLLALSVIDLELYLLPNAIVYPAALVSVPAIYALAAQADDEPGRVLLRALVAGTAYAAVLGVTLVVFELLTRREGLGWGDVKLAFLLGLWLGHRDPLLVLPALVLASVLGLVVGLLVLAVRRVNRPFPFGPAMAASAVAVLLVGPGLVETLQA